MKSVDETLGNTSSNHPQVVSENPNRVKRLRNGVKVRLPRICVSEHHKPFVFNPTEGQCCKEKRLRSNGVKVRLPRPIPSICVSEHHTPFEYVNLELSTREESLAYAQTALSTFNQKKKKEEPEYELVEAVSCIRFPRYCYRHCNFIARQKNDSDAEDMLFFAELCYVTKEQARICKMCCILGPRGTETPKSSCTTCEKYPGLIQHPPDGFTTFLTLRDEYNRRFVSEPFVFNSTEGQFCKEEKRLPNGVKVRLPKPRITGSEHHKRFEYVNIDIPEESLAYAQTALSFFNQKKKKEEPEYELVEALSCIRFPRFCYRHCNFIARQKNDSNAEDELFFAELCYYDEEAIHTPRICFMCCILGPRGTETPKSSCTTCEKYQGLVQHPLDGFTTFRTLYDEYKGRFVRS